jgi:photosystem II stability/assembly factor-like uncharacterized protein
MGRLSHLAAACLSADSLPRAEHGSPVDVERKMASSKRELIAPNGDKRLVRRDEQGRIKESDDLGKSLAQDVRKSAKSKVGSGQGDRGDQKSRK